MAAAGHARLGLWRRDAADPSLGSGADCPDQGRSAPTPALLVAATIGNVAGSAFNWWLGLNARRFEDRRWFPFSPATIAAASNRFRRFGLWSLLLAWVPIIGDPLTFIAGVLQVPFRYFLPLVAIGKAARYAIVVASL